MTDATEVHVRSVLERLVCEALALTPDQLTPDASFVGDLGADSLDMIDLVSSIETELNLRIRESELVNMTTVGSAAHYLTERLEKQRQAAAQDSAEGNP